MEDRIKNKLSELFNDIIVANAEYGGSWIIERGRAEVYFGGRSEQGWIYKNYDAYENHLNKVCYISEYGFDDYYNDLFHLFDLYHNKEFNIESLYEELANVSGGYTHKDILDLCNGQEEVAIAVFDTIDWQYPETYIEEMYSYSELDEYGDILVLTEGMELEEFLFEKYKEDWCKERGYTLSDIDEELGINGECFACYEEFLNNEYKNEEYMLYLIKKNQNLESTPLDQQVESFIAQKNEFNHNNSKVSVKEKTYE